MMVVVIQSFVERWRDIEALGNIASYTHLATPAVPQCLWPSVNSAGDAVQPLQRPRTTGHGGAVVQKQPRSILSIDQPTLESQVHTYIHRRVPTNNTPPTSATELLESHLTLQSKYSLLLLLWLTSILHLQSRKLRMSSTVVVCSLPTMQFTPPCAPPLSFPLELGI